eukprot:Gb_11106 [translate_table: standard]
MQKVGDFCVVRPSEFTQIFPSLRQLVGQLYSLAISSPAITLFSGYVLLYNGVASHVPCASITQPFNKSQAFGYVNCATSSVWALLYVANPPTMLMWLAQANVSNGFQDSSTTRVSTFNDLP